MTREQIAASTAQALRAAHLPRLSAFLGFDGFADDIIDVVDQRPPGGTYKDYSPIASLKDFGNRLAATTGHGTNVELVVKRQKLGGNAPIMGNALALLGMTVTCAAALGDAGNGIHPVFRDFAARATLIPIADAAHTLALEFADGKAMLNELAPLAQITFARLIEKVGRDRLICLCEQATLLGLLNWTMIPAATEVWRGFAEEVIPRLTRKPRIFVDLADPRKRTPADLAAALQLLAQFGALGAPVTLGLNEQEARQTAAVLQLPPAAPVQLASAIRRNLNLDTVVIHPAAGAAAATAQDAAEFPGPFTATPAILTGGGDHFNAGFALGQLLQLPLEQSLCLGTATSGYYVHHAASPTIPKLVQFLEGLPPPR